MHTRHKMCVCVGGGGGDGCERVCVCVGNNSFTFSLSVPSNLESTRFLSIPGPWAVGREDWKMKRRPLHSAACKEERSSNYTCCHHHHD